MKATMFALLILMFFCLMSRIDYIVNGLLYNHGLRFSYDWAVQYWITYDSVFVVFSVILGVAYWFGSNKTTRDLKVSLALVATVDFLALGGIQDIMFFVFWSGGLPPTNIVWWWVPWQRVFGTWNSLMQISLASLMTCSTAFTWQRAIKSSACITDERPSRIVAPNLARARQHDTPKKNRRGKHKARRQNQSQDPVNAGKAHQRTRARALTMTVNTEQTRRKIEA